jgi:hypothetical protein
MKKGALKSPLFYWPLKVIKISYRGNNGRVRYCIGHCILVIGFSPIGAICSIYLPSPPLPSPLRLRYH